MDLDWPLRIQCKVSFGGLLGVLELMCSEFEVCLSALLVSCLSTTFVLVDPLGLFLIDSGDCQGAILHRSGAHACLDVLCVRMDSKACRHRRTRL